MLCRVRQRDVYKRQVLLCGTALAMLIWKRKQENRPEEIDEENMEDFAE